MRMPGVTSDHETMKFENAKPLSVTISTEDGALTTLSPFAVVGLASETKSVTKSRVAC